MAASCQTGGGPMIRLSDVKVRLQYRWRVRQRLMVLHFARLHGPAAAGRRFGVSVRTIGRWRVQWRQDGLEGLVPRYPRRRGRRVTPRVIELIGHARRELGYGAARTQLWLRRVHDVRVAMGTIQRIFRDLGIPRLRRTRKRVPRQMKLFEKAEPGESVQVDVKFVKIAGRWAFQYTALDDCTRFRVLRLYPRLHQRSSRTGRRSAAIGSTRRSFGDAIGLQTSTRRPPPFGHGSERTTTNGSPWPCRGARQPRSSLACAPAGPGRTVRSCTFAPMPEGRWSPRRSL